MARRVFFSFEYSDVQRAMTVRNSNAIRGTQAAGFIDKAEFEKVERSGDQAIQDWIDKQLEGTTVTVVLVGANTFSSKWVKYEISKSIARGNGLLGIDISQIRDFNGATSYCCGQLPAGYPFYRWVSDNGYENLGAWVEKAAQAAGF